MAKKLNVAKGKKTVEDALKSAQKVIDLRGLKKIVKIEKPKGRDLAALESEKEFDPKLTYGAEIESTVTIKKPGVVTVYLIANDVRIAVGSGAVDSLKNAVIAQSLAECGLA
jgi:hypothetical protein